MSYQDCSREPLRLSALRNPFSAGLEHFTDVRRPRPIQTEDDAAIVNKTLLFHWMARLASETLSVGLLRLGVRNEISKSGRRFSSV